jgi:cellulose synthase/poly-beta-1,6-N-acetylglucosamine synthase-like glycosyltransferase
MFYILLFIFIASLLLCLTTYLFYPIALIILSYIFGKRPNKSHFLPSISIIISAYNEENDIFKKINNTLELDYPHDKIEILIGSDGSSDKTPKILSEYQHKNITTYIFEENRGKTAVQNDLVKSAKGEILVFTDAASFLPRESLLNLVRNFADGDVGCVAGKMRFIDTDSNITTQSQGIYWRYEVKLRELESSLGSLIGVDGPLYAVRATSYIPLEHNIISDFITPLLVLEQGKKVYLEPEAFVEEEPTQKEEHEFKTRRRITLRGLIGIFSHSSLLNILKHPALSTQIICHKLLRWFVGPLITLNFLSCLLLLNYNILIFEIIFYLYMILFLAALAGHSFSFEGKLKKLIAIPYYFILVNTAATFGIFDFFRKKQAITWSPERNK